MVEKLGNFMEKYAGFIIGVLIGIIFVAVNLTMIIINIAIIVAFGFLGKYIQTNKDGLKDKIKKLVEKW